MSSDPFNKTERERQENMCRHRLAYSSRAAAKTPTAAARLPLTMLAETAPAVTTTPEALPVLEAVGEKVPLRVLLPGLPEEPEEPLPPPPPLPLPEVGKAVGGVKVWTIGDVQGTSTIMLVVVGVRARWAPLVVVTTAAEPVPLAWLLLV